MTAADEAKQLDSVTDRVMDQESMSASKATEAMSALASKRNKDDQDVLLDNIQVSREDVDLIVSELEVTEEVATKALKEVLSQGLVGEGQSAVGEALRKLVVSPSTIST
jgi:NACalpha-BTF3-like transcription factor